MGHLFMVEAEGRYPPGGLRSATLHSGPSHCLLRPRQGGNLYPTGPSPLPVSRPLKKGPVFYALECGIFEQPSELFDSLVGFSILRGLFC